MYFITLTLIVGCQLASGVFNNDAYGGYDDSYSNSLGFESPYDNYEPEEDWFNDHNEQKMHYPDYYDYAVPSSYHMKAQDNDEEASIIHTYPTESEDVTHHTSIVQSSLTNPTENPNEYQHLTNKENPSTKHLLNDQPKVSAHHHENTGCRGSGLCCQGKDNNCRTKGPRMNGSNNHTCYCDSNCLFLRDCCTDYTDHCKKVACLQSQWGEWSDCDVPCGFGVRHRERGIIQEPRNGAPECEATTQKQVCEGISCKKARGLEDSGEELRETARILALKYGEWREAYKYDPLKDIRRNIYHHLGHNSTQRSQLNYCGVYKLEYVQPSCGKAHSESSALPPSHHSSQPSSQQQLEGTPLEKGLEVCVECQHTAINSDLGSRCYGHGVQGKVTKWTTLEKRACRGTWVLEQRRQQCSCQLMYPELRGFIFV